MPKYWPNTCCTRCLSATAMNRVSAHSGGTAFTTQAVLPLTSASGSIAFRLDTDLPSVRWKGHHHCRDDLVVHGVGAQATRPAFSSPGFMRGHFPGPPSASQRAPAAQARPYHGRQEQRAATSSTWRCAPTGFCVDPLPLLQESRCPWIFREPDTAFGAPWHWLLQVALFSCRGKWHKRGVEKGG